MNRRSLFKGLAGLAAGGVAAMADRPRARGMPLADFLELACVSGAKAVHINARPRPSSFASPPLICEVIRTQYGPLYVEY